MFSILIRRSQSPLLREVPVAQLSQRVMTSKVVLGPRQPQVGQDVLLKEPPRPYVPPEQTIDAHREGEGDTMKAIRLAVGSLRGKPFVELRQWEVDEDDDELLPTFKGLSMSLEQFHALRKAIPDIEKLAAKP